MKVLSVDIGATSGRVMTVTFSDGKLSYQENHRFPNRVYDDQGTLRWDFSYLLHNIIEGIRIGLKQNPDVSSIGIDTWAVDYGFVKDGKLIQDPKCYRDTHSFEAQKKLLEKTPYSSIYHITGIQNLHFNTIYQLYDEKRDYSGLTFLMIPDLIAYFLTGVMKLEETNASTTSLYDKRTGRMSSDLLDLIHTPASVFPEIIHPGETYGFLKKEYVPDEVNHPIPVIAVGTHDTASAVLGTSGEGKFAYISSGTWSLIGTELKDLMINEEGMKANFTNEIGYGSSVRFLKNTMGMFLINEVRNDYADKGTEVKVSDIAGLVEKAEDVDCYLDVNDPLFETPGEMLSKVHEYILRTHQSEPRTPGEMMKVIYKSMALCYRSIIETLEQLTGETFDSINIVGGGNQASVLNAYTASACHKKTITGASEATVLGNGLAQLLALKAIPSVSEGRKIISDSIQAHVFEPKDKEYWDEEYGKFRKKIFWKGE